LTSSATPVHEESLPNSLSIEQQKEAFTAATSQYFSLLSSLDVRLRRQIYALEEAQILPKDASTKEPRNSQASSLGFPGMGSTANMPLPTQYGGGKGPITGGGLGNLDIGWLNSRNDNVGKEKEAELWEDALRIVQRLEEGKLENEQDHGVREEDIENGEPTAHGQNSGDQMEHT
jgi:hypothetical protein